MSRNIRNDHPWDDDEKAYFASRAGGQELIALNESQFPPGSEPDVKPDDDEELELSQEVYDHVRNLEVDEAQAELKQYGLSTKGDEQELKVRLAQHLQEQKNKK
jgi:hypothetical protein